MKSLLPFSAGVIYLKFRARSASSILATIKIFHGQLKTIKYLYR